MEIKTNYAINDTVYFLAENSVRVGAITEIRICVDSLNIIQVRYDVKCSIPNEAKFTDLKGNRLFKSKEALIASL